MLYLHKPQCKSSLEIASSAAALGHAWHELGSHVTARFTGGLNGSWQTLSRSIGEIRIGPCWQVKLLRRANFLPKAENACPAARLIAHNFIARSVDLRLCHSNTLREIPVHLGPTAFEPRCDQLSAFLHLALSLDLVQRGPHVPNCRSLSMCRFLSSRSLSLSTMRSG